MGERINFFVGLGAHEDSNSIAVCSSRDPARFAGTVDADVRQPLKALAKARASTPTP
ncbi:hypothetical protein [Roseateles sp.]|uniref:hypothetical protein n=1 Tax=Roseateles sp. TaxID=1971397 RepID=UPI0025D0E60A|nr:hypothetical protein [Roseateles sp.]MBV8034589.1 hypothetical protein [Roseateles sp.]